MKQKKNSQHNKAKKKCYGPHRPLAVHRYCRVCGKLNSLELSNRNGPFCDEHLSEFYFLKEKMDLVIAEKAKATHYSFKALYREPPTVRIRYVAKGRTTDRGYIQT